MEDCVFCKIGAGEIPSYKVYEDEEFLAFLDISPRNPGHTLIIPKEHYRWVWDVENKKRYLEIAADIAKKLQKSMGTEVIALVSVGTEVPHAHFHLVPKFKGDEHEGRFIDPNVIRKISPEEMKEIAEKIKNA